MEIAGVELTIKSISIVGISFMVLLAFKKYFPGMVADWAGDFIGKLLHPIDSDVKNDPMKYQLRGEMVFAIVKYAEYLYPDRGMGIKRFKFVRAILSKMLRAEKAEMISATIEEAVQKMDDEAKKIISDEESKKKT